MKVEIAAEKLIALLSLASKASDMAGADEITAYTDTWDAVMQSLDLKPGELWEKVHNVDKEPMSIAEFV